MFNEEKKSVWEMTEEEQKKYYDEKSNEVIETAITQILRNRVMLNRKIREKIQEEVDRIVKDAINGKI